MPCPSIVAFTAGLLWKPTLSHTTGGGGAPMWMLMVVCGAFAATLKAGPA
jgi:hypothetical protein